MHRPPGLFPLEQVSMAGHTEEERSNYHLGTQEYQQLPFLKQHHPAEVEDL